MCFSSSALLLARNVIELRLEPAPHRFRGSCVFSPPRSISRPIPFTVLQPIEAKIPAIENRDGN